MLLALTNSSGTKDVIVSLLSQKWPLTAKQIWTFVVKRNKMSYQAVHKDLNELVSAGSVLKKGKNYSLNPAFVSRMHNHWSAIEENYKSKKGSRIGFISGSKVVTPTAIYSFEKHALNVGFIPSVFISKATLQEFVELSSVGDLEKLAKKIAVRDYDYILGHMLQKKEFEVNPLLALEKLNVLATDFYWGRVSYKIKDDEIEIKIDSDVYTTKKGKLFYDKLYEFFMEILGYELVKRNVLETTYTYKRKSA